ncbi:(2Fe-2S) ferredoxin domain-containing protein [Leptolyngbya sp. 'hensonii']|uniref:(2Fe-2S) ferredoxin domain-containing protein n=1 Tax=Leptolyngbya sp. 'hensonii' TaxID=1922337 RepID=UPI000A6D728E|nr:(2Fe-2S) ferredoxin domain-containing protein [Leptolyngbya sp. 'hensonii']
MGSLRQVSVCQHTNCLQNGSSEVLGAFEAQPISGVTVCATGCLGQCNMGPTVHIEPDQTWYCRVKPQDVPEIVDRHLQGNEPVKRLLHPRFHPQFIE